MPDGHHPDLDLRVVRHFVLVAERQSVTRAAAELRIAQPALGRQIRALERLLGAQLFDRTPSGARLTAAGETFLPHARGLLRAAQDAVDAVAGLSATFVLGYSTGLEVTTLVRALRNLFPDVVVRTAHLGWRRPAQPLRTAEVDAVVAWLPFRADGLTVDVLHEEERVLAVHRTHPLAGRTSVRVGEIVDEPLPELTDLDEDERRFWRVDRDERDSAPSARSAPPAGLDDTWQRISQGDIVAVATRTHARSAHDDTVLVPLEDAPPAQVVLATRAHDRSPVVGALRGHARQWWIEQQRA